MSSMSDYLEDQLTEYLFANGIYSLSDIYVALCKASVSDSDTGTSIQANEPSGAEYVRQYIPNGTDWDVNNNIASNASNVTFPVAETNWGTITHVALVDDLTAGNLLFHAALAESKTIAIDDVFQFSTGDLTVTFD